MGGRWGGSGCLLCRNRNQQLQHSSKPSPISVPHGWQGGPQNVLMPWRDWRCIKSSRRWANPEGLWAKESLFPFSVHQFTTSLHRASRAQACVPSPCSPWTTREGGPEIDHVSLPHHARVSVRVSSRLESAPTAQVTSPSFLLPLDIFFPPEQNQHHSNPKHWPFLAS